VAIKVYFSFNFAGVFDFRLFPVPPSKAKSIGDVLTNRQIDAPNHPALLGYAQGIGNKNPRNKVGKL
jgi:hypothetical protein